jgi:hypothetical protein
VSAAPGAGAPRMAYLPGAAREEVETAAISLSSLSLSLSLSLSRARFVACPERAALSQPPIGCSMLDRVRWD